MTLNEQIWAYQQAMDELFRNDMCYLPYNVEGEISAIDIRMWAIGIIILILTILISDKLSTKKK